MSATQLPHHGSRTSAVDVEIASHCLFCGCAAKTVECDNVQDFFFQNDDGAFAYYRCEDCKSLWLDKRPVGQRLLNAYANYYTHTAPRPTIHRSGLRGVLRSRYIRSRFGLSSSWVDDWIAQFSRLIGRDNSNIDEQYRFAPKAPGSILDYGCGSGEYLLRMQPFGHALYGIEYDPHLLKELTRHGIKIFDASSTDECRWQNEFDHITLSHVIEHVADPGVLLERLFTWLKPGGTFFVEVPNADATGLEIFGKYWRGLEAPRHFAIPTRAALVQALERAGFTVQRQHINNTARMRVWNISLGACPPHEHSSLISAMSKAPPENEANAEFLTFVAKKLTS